MRHRADARKRRPLLGTLAALAAIATACGGGRGAAAVVPDLSAYSPDCGIAMEAANGKLRCSWPLSGAEGSDQGVLVLDLDPDRPLIASLGITGGAGAVPLTLLEGAAPAAFLTAGSRAAPSGRPPDMSDFNVFFDNPASRPHEGHVARLLLRRARAASGGRRATVTLGELALGPFTGTLVFSMYAGAPLLHVEAAVSTPDEKRAILYDAGLLFEPGAGDEVVWLDAEKQLRRERADPGAADHPLAVRHRTLVYERTRERGGGSLACFPPPHQYFFPRDLTDNLRTVWFGRGHGAPAAGFGFGIRQEKTGGGGWVPWFNAPRGTIQRLGVFYLLHRGPAPAALAEVLRFTRGDAFARLPGHLTFTSHWHMAIAVISMGWREAGRSPLPIPEFAGMFREMGVDMVHLAEFHGDGHQRDPGPKRLPELEAMFAECRRLSDDRLLLIPGEEVNTFLGMEERGKHPGHWMSLFPRPVRWVMQRGAGESFVAEGGGAGSGESHYRVGSRADMVELLAREGGLAWTAHPRIKASSWTPDIFRNEDFYRAASWLGAAWKAMPADLSRERLGERGLDLLDDMANWGGRKYLPGEVDVFKIDHTHELYAHMNVNYLRLERLPRFDDGWKPVLDALRTGAFFVTTGEVLIREFTAGGKQSGEVLALGAGAAPEVRVALEWTFPLRFAEVISGDGARVHRERLDLADTGAFGTRTLTFRPELRGRKWLRFEAWDIAANGAFTQPVWIEEAPAGEKPN